MNTSMNIQKISVDQLKPAKYNPRKDLKPGDPAYEKIRRSLHEFGLLVSKAEAIRTQWATGRQMNGRTARQLEDTQANVNAAQEAARLIRERGEGGKRNAFL